MKKEKKVYYLLKNSEKKEKKKDPNKIGKAQKQKSNKIKIMGSFFFKNNIIFFIEIVIIMLISLSYYLVSLLIEYSKKKSVFDFYSVNSQMNSVFIECFYNFITLKNQLDLFEDTLVNCKPVENGQIIYKMNFPEIDKLNTPNFGNNIMKITSDFGFKTESLSNFSLLFSEDACKALTETEYENYICIQNFGDVLSQGMEHSISKIGSLFGTVIEELNSINNEGSLFIEKVNDSKFHSLELYFIFYFQKSLRLANNILTQLSSELLTNIKKLLKMLVIMYLIIIIFLFSALFYFLNSFKNVFNSFLFFIAILPFKYILEDNKFYNEIIKFGNKYY
jgi:hypothetical protein